MGSSFWYKLDLYSRGYLFHKGDLTRNLLLYIIQKCKEAPGCVYTLTSLGSGSIFFSQGKEVARRQFKIQKTFSKIKTKTITDDISDYCL